MRSDKERARNEKRRKQVIKQGLDMYKTADLPLYMIPGSAQDLIDIVSISPSGLFELPDKRYSKTWEIEDINYNLASEEEREELQFKYASQLISVMQHPFKITVFNHKKDPEKLEEEYLYPKNQGCSDHLLESVNSAIMEWLLNGRGGYEQRKYFTVSEKCESKEEADRLFQAVEDDVKRGFSSLDTNVIGLDGNERLHLIRDILNPYCEEELPDIRAMYASGRDFKNEIVPDGGFDFTDIRQETFLIGGRIATVLHAIRYPNSLNDNFMDEILNLPMESVLSIDGVPIPAETARKFVESIYMDVEDKIAKQQEKRNRNRAYASDISYKKRREKEDVENYLDELREADQRMLLGSLVLCIIADSREELESQVAAVKTIGARYSVHMETAWMYQREYFATVLPIGNRQIDSMRAMLSSDIAAMIPFQSAILRTKGTQICYGTNQVSGNPVWGNRKQLTFGGGFYFGKPGSGKSHDAKQEMAAILASTDDDIIVIDPTMEYGGELAKEFEGEFFNFSPSSSDYLNPLNIPMWMYESSELEQFIKDASDYMISQAALMMEGEITSGHRTIISRGVRKMYEDIAKLPLSERYIPVMGNLRKVIASYSEDEAKKIALAMELYTDGAFSMFNHQTNISLNKRFTVFGIRDVGENMYGQAMLAITRHIDERVKKNWRENRSTWIYMDEIHRVLKNPVSASYMDKNWREHRKMNAIDTGLTHTIEEVLQNDIAGAMVKNSEFIFILKSSKTSVNEMMSSIEGMKPELFRFMINAPVGTGILKHGAQLIPINGRLSESNPLSRIFNTDPHKTV